MFLIIILYNLRDILFLGGPCRTECLNTKLPLFNLLDTEATEAEYNVKLINRQEKKKDNLFFVLYTYKYNINIFPGSCSIFLGPFPSKSGVQTRHARDISTFAVRTIH